MTHSPDRIDRYLALAKSRPDAFANTDPDGIIILDDRDAILSAERTIKERYRAKGHPEDWAECAIYYEDPWMYLVRDVVRFPDDSTGTYHHIVLKGGPDGVVVLPLLDGKAVLIRHFRNGARSWSWEIPRGGPRAVDPIENAKDELVEEIGAEITDIRRLGQLRNNNGMITEVMHIYVATLSAIGHGNLGEGIGRIELVTPDRLGAMIRDGEIDDSHTVHAYTLARLNGIF
ncbi:MAG: NUDIX hydrolase [Alphaproteobacteria bacterium]